MANRNTLLSTHNPKHCIGPHSQQQRAPVACEPLGAFQPTWVVSSPASGRRTPTDWMRPLRLIMPTKRGGRCVEEESRDRQCWRPATCPLTWHVPLHQQQRFSSLVASSSVVARVLLDTKSRVSVTRSRLLRIFVDYVSNLSLSVITCTIDQELAYATACVGYRRWEVSSFCF